MLLEIKYKLSNTHWLECLTSIQECWLIKVILAKIGQSTSIKQDSLNVLGNEGRFVFLANLKDDLFY